MVTHHYGQGVQTLAVINEVVDDFGNELMLLEDEGYTFTQDTFGAAFWFAEQGLEVS